jgi:hypothetical protein
MPDKQRLKIQNGQLVLKVAIKRNWKPPKRLNKQKRKQSVRRY